MYHHSEKCVKNKARLAKLLSKNSTHHRYNETEDEWFMRTLNIMMDEVEDANGVLAEEVHERFTGIAREKASAYGDIMGSPGVISMIVKIWPLREYFSMTKIMRANYLKKKLIGNNVGVSDFVTEKGVGTDSIHAPSDHVIHHAKGV